MPDPQTPAKGLTQPQVGGDNNTWGNLLNTNLALIDTALGGTLALSISGNTTLNSTQIQNTGYEFSGSLSGTATITWSSFSGFAAIQNNTTGGHSIVCGIGGATVTVQDGETVAVWSDGTNFTRLTQSAVRLIALATVNFYVATTGSDSNNGLSSGAPFLTLQHAINVALSYDAGGWDVIINIANGTYQGFLCLSPLVGANSAGIQIKGTNGSANVTIADTTTNPAAILTANDCVLTLSGLTITSTNGSDLFPSYAAHIKVGSDVVFGASHFGQIHAETGGSVEFSESTTFTGNAPAAVQAVLGGQIIFDDGSAITVTITGTPAYSIGWADIEGSGSRLYVPSGSLTFSGSATGPRFYVTDSASITTNGGTAIYFPGSTAGIEYHGGVYSPPLAPTITSAGVTGLGTGGSPGAIFTTGASNQGGIIQLTTGSSGTGVSGSVPLVFSVHQGINSVICTAFLIPGGSSWAATATTQISSSSTGGVTLNWFTNGGALATGSTYYIGYSCPGGGS